MAEPLTEDTALTLAPGTVLHRITSGFEWTRVVHEVTTIKADEDGGNAANVGKLDQILFVPLPEKPVPPWAHDAIGPMVLHQWVVVE